ncbi:MAG: amino acid adenylation domain-containing protein [Halanaerobiales bacterium]|nr:amino acid adenylation domain-containing protein [Halanaerobiales bacterium]
MKKQEEYWFERFSDSTQNDGQVPILNIPTDYSRSLKQSFEGDHVTFKLDQNLTKNLKRIASDTGSTLYMVLLSGINILLSKYSGQEDIIVGSPIAGRPHADLEKIIGMFVNTLAMRNYPHGNKTYEEFLRKVKENALNAYENQDYQFEELVDKLNLKRDLSRNPLFDVMFMLQNFNNEELRIENLELKLYDYNSRISKFDLTISASEVMSIGVNEEIILNFEYRKRLYKKKTVERMILHFKNILKVVAANTKIKLSEIEMLTEEEKEKILYEFNNTTADYLKDKTIHELFEEQALKTPCETAVVFNEFQLTYQELNEKANQLAKKLRQMGVGPDQIVGILTESSFEMVIGLLSILKAGGAYVPIDPHYPLERINYILSDVNAEILLIQEELKEMIKSIGQNNSVEHLEFQGQVLILDNQENYLDKSNNADVTNLSVINKPTDLAYIIYTSGSSGMPKGVMIEHRNVTNVLIWYGQQFNLKPDKRVMQMTNYTFDPSIEQIFGSLTHGATVYLINRDLRANSDQFGQFIENNQIEMIDLVPFTLKELLLKQKSKLNSLEIVISGGERLSETLKDEVLKKGYTLYNNYGPTETTIDATIDLCSENPVSLGRPIANTKCYIFDTQNNLVPVGVVGELCIGGVGVARGYLNNPKLTSEKFVEDPFIPGKRIYRTGDLARWKSDGQIEFIGRVDHQVKIRGFRVEPGEIENQILHLPEIIQAVVVDYKNSDGNSYLAAYFVAEDEIEISEIRNYLSSKLPNYMVPAYFVQMNKMPTLPNGKINRKALPKLELNNESQREYIKPRNVIEEKLAELWANVLAIEKVGIEDNFFELGGHSLKATILVSKIHKEMNFEVSLSEIFKRPTIKELAQYIAGLKENLYSSILPVEEKEYYLSSSAQKRLYLQYQFEGAGLSYNMPGAVLVEGTLNRRKFEKVFSQLLQRHETLRTSFDMIDGEIIQKVHSEVNFEVSFIQLSEDNANEKSIISHAFSEFVRSFDLGKAPLIRVRLAKITENRNVIMFDMHHIISDGVSMELLISEFIALYRDRTLPKLRIQYKDFSAWQNELFQTDLIKRQEKYWLDIFACSQAGEIPLLNMPTDYPRQSVQSFRGDRVIFEIDNELTARLKELSESTGSTIYMVLFAAYYVLLSKYTRQEDIIIGSPIAGRRHADLENIIGMFVNMVALRNTPCSGKTFMSFLGEVRENIIKAFDNQDYQFEELVEKLNLQRDLSRNPLFDVVFSLQDTTRQTVIDTDDFRFVPLNFESNVSKFDMMMEAVKESNRMWFTLEYCEDLFIKETMERLSNNFINILKEITKNPEVNLGKINMLSKAEMRQLLKEFNNTKMEFAKDKTLHEMFVEQVEKAIQKTAIVFADEKLTYGELNKKVNQLAHHLRNLRVNRDEIIGIMAERSIDMVIGILSVLKAGGAYMPIDPDYPVERITYMLEDSKARILLTHNNYADRIEYSGEIIDLSSRLVYIGDGQNLININKPHDLAYVMYTSGSTGKPKGVMIEHQGVVSLANYYNEMYKLDQGKNILHMSNVSFDISVVEIFPSLIYGSTIYVIRKELALDRQRFIEFIQENQIHFAQFVPMMLYEILGQSEKVESLNAVISTGDKLDDTVKDQTLSKGYQLTNNYGPTEVTIHSTVAICEIGKSTIGKPVANTSVYILDKDNNLTPIGVPGELCISGVGLARGYLNRPELTAEKFVPNPWLPGERMYRTGDLACWQSDRNITYLGRIDNQVKIKGYRIELGEIEQQLLKHESVDGVVVVDRVDSNGMKYLMAYIVAEREFTVSELRRHLAQKLPDYMIPSHFMQIENIPLTHNGKVDRRALPNPEGGIDVAVEYIPPTNQIEEKLIAIWQKLLMIEEIGINHNFFEMGGHSLKAVQVVNLVHKELNFQISLQDIFTAPTIKELGKLILSKETLTFSAIKKLPKQEYYELSYNQKRLWIISQLEPANSAYNMAGRITFNEEVDEEIITRVFDQLVNRHENLRTQFKVVDGSPVQVINSGDCFKLQIFDLFNLSENERSFEREAIYEKLTAEPFNMIENSFLRAALVKFSEHQFDIVFCMHHIISDGWSLEILKKEFYLLYNAYKEGKEFELASLTVQYKDFAAWQNQLIADENENQQAREYWMNKLSRGFPVLNLPEDYSSDVLKNRRSAGYRIFIPEMIKDQLKATAINHNTSLFIVMTTAIKMFFADLTGQDEIAIGVPSMGRQHQNLNNVIGFFINTIVLINRVSSSFEEMLDMVHEDTIKALEYQDYPLELITDELKIKYPKIQVFFNLLNMGESHLESVENTESYHIEKVQDVKFDIMFYLTEYDNGIELLCTYLTGLYKPTTIEYIVGEYIRFITKLLGCEEQPDDDDFDDDDFIITKG